MSIRSETYRNRKKWIEENVHYTMAYYSDFNYELLKCVMYEKRAGRGDNSTYNDVLIMADTETSKHTHTGIEENHIVCWSVSIRAFNHNIVTLYGGKPTELVDTINRILEQFKGEHTVIYWHNLSYDWVFIRKFMFKQFGEPTHMLSTKPHYPIMIEWENGLMFKDSLILAQRKLEKWANDLDVEHKKAVGCWDYDKIRNQDDVFYLTTEELKYIEQDTLAGVECLQKTMDKLNKHIYSMPMTATGIPREEVRKLGKENNAREKYKKQCPTFEQQMKLEKVYHGGFTHGNRHYLNTTITEECFGIIEGLDFSSSYPFCLLAFTYPCEKFTPTDNCKLSYILLSAEKYAFIFKLILYKPRLKSDSVPMPCLQYSKCEKSINAVLDNGRILCADYIEIYINEIDAQLIDRYYTFEGHLCVEVESAMKSYLPRWFTDYVYNCYKNKTILKDTGDGNYDAVLYSIAKSLINSLYGMCVQKPIKENIIEDYATGTYTVEENEPADLYEKHTKKQTSILPYVWGVWCTSYAMRNLFTLGGCCKWWWYSDTDSCYGSQWDFEKVDVYNERCKKLLRQNGYDAVLFNNREYWLGIAERDADSVYTEFRYMGSKRYCGRSLKDGQLHITVAGVPKKAFKCLKDDITNFKPFMVFDGVTSGKMQHTYFFTDAIKVDDKGNELGDSIDLSPCDYLLDVTDRIDMMSVLTDYVEIQVYTDL